MSFIYAFSKVQLMTLYCMHSNIKMLSFFTFGVSIIFQIVHEQIMKFIHVMLTDHRVPLGPFLVFCFYYLFTWHALA